MSDSPTNPLCLFAPVQPPTGTVSNFDDPPSLDTTAVAVCSIMMAWATVFVAGRLYVNFRKLSLADCRSIWRLLEFVVTRSLGAKLTASLTDLALAAFVFDIAYTAVIFDVRHMFRHMWDIPIVRGPLQQTCTIFV